MLWLEALLHFQPSRLSPVLTVRFTCSDLYLLVLRLHGLPMKGLKISLKGRSTFSTARPRLAGLPSDRPLVMGIVNVTPDSFSDGGHFAATGDAVNHAFDLLMQGADILDIGRESTRPGAIPVPVEEELRRVVPVVEGYPPSRCEKTGDQH